MGSTPNLLRLTNKIEKIPVFFRLLFVALINLIIHIGLITSPECQSWYQQCGYYLNLIMTAFVSLGIYIISLPTGLILLFLLRIKNWWLVAIFASFLNLHFFAISTALENWTDYSVYIFMSIAYLLSLFTADFIINRLKANETIKWVICIVLILLNFFLFPYVGDKLNIFLSNKKSIQNNNKYVREIFNKTRAGDPTGFNVYAPTFIPPGFSLDEGKVSAFSDKTYYRFTYHKPSFYTHSIDIISFTKPSYYNPPTDCGRTPPDFNNQQHYVQSCQFLEKLKNGSAVYYIQYGYSTLTKIDYYTVFGNTQITLTDEPHGNEQLTKEEVIAIFNSLQEKSLDELLK